MMDNRHPRWAHTETRDAEHIKLSAAGKRGLAEVAAHVDHIDRRRCFCSRDDEALEVNIAAVNSTVLVIPHKDAPEWWRRGEFGVGARGDAHVLEGRSAGIGIDGKLP